MKLLFDAQLPRRLVRTCESLQWDAIHTLDLREGNRTPDVEVSRVADAEDRFVVTKDADFVHSHLLQNRPKRLLLIATGNIGNEALVRLLVQHASLIEELAGESHRLTLTPRGVLVGLPS